MIHHKYTPVGPSSSWKGAVLATIVLAMSAYLLIKGGWLVLVPFALAAVIVAALALYLRWLHHPGA